MDFAAMLNILTLVVEGFSGVAKAAAVHEAMNSHPGMVQARSALAVAQAALEAAQGAAGRANPAADTAARAAGEAAGSAGAQVVRQVESVVKG